MCKFGFTDGNFILIIHHLEMLLPYCVHPLVHSFLGPYKNLFTTIHHSGTVYSRFTVWFLFLKTAKTFLVLGCCICFLPFGMFLPIFDHCYLLSVKFLRPLTSSKLATDLWSLGTSYYIILLLFFPIHSHCLNYRGCLFISIIQSHVTAPPILSTKQYQQEYRHTFRKLWTLW